MQTLNSFKTQVLELKKSSFDTLALKIFRFQAKNNPVYHKYLNFLNKDYTQIKSILEIPFLPIEFFKQHKIATGNWTTEKTFLSSGTTSNTRSTHEIEDLSFYHKISASIFSNQFSSLSNTAFIALLPSYIEQGQSSLVEMLKYFIEKSNIEQSGFYLNNQDKLIHTINDLKSNGIKIVVFAVTYALLDLVEKENLDFSNVKVIETGGMKGRRKEMPKEQVYNILKDRLNLEAIQSEYGMTELLSQAYAHKNGILEVPNSMKILIRDLNDPFKYKPNEKSGGINIIDLANIHSCSFIETKDIGVKIHANKFKILGRFDNSDIRGCNLMIN